MAEIIGERFEIGAPLGQGGMGTVYHGLDQQTGQPVAIKLLKPELVTSNRDMVERFAREGEALRRLNHPNIVKMLTLLTENDRYYLVMEFVGGGSLADLLAQEQQLPIETVLHVALELADALTRAHHLKIIHRDIKPANVLLAEDGTPRLTDFGIARLDDQSRMTESGLVVGTFAYLSPEACEGRELDARTDIWSFGVMLYEMLAGRKPFENETTAGTITSILMHPPPDIRALRPDTPPELVFLISKMLQKDRTKRIASIRQVGAELEGILRGDTQTPVGVHQSDLSQLPIESRFATPTPTDDSPTTIGSTPSMTGTMGGVRPSPTRSRLVWIGGIIVVLVVGLAALFASGVLNGAGAGTPTAAVQAAAAGDYMVLVAPFSAIRTDVRDVAGLITQDLKQHFENEVSYSKLRIRQYPTTITSDDEAKKAAESVGASVVVWGNYTADTVNANVQIGSLVAFKYNHFDRTTLEKTANVQAQMTDETKQSLAPQVLGVLAILSFADGDQYGTGRAVAALNTIQVDEATFVGNSVAVRVQRYFQSPITDTSQTMQEINAALGDDSSNALLYALRSQTHLRTLGLSGISPQDSADAQQDAETAQLLGPKGWAMPYVLLSLTYFQSTITNLSQIIEQRPDDWFAYFTRSAHYYGQGDFDHARADIEQAIALKPDVNFPYMLATFIAWREGRLAEAVAYSNFTLNNLPSTPDFLKRIFDALWSDAAIYAPLPPNNLRMFHYLILGQYDDARQSYNLESKTYLQGPHIITDGDSLVLFGFTYCNLGDYSKAEQLFDIVLSSKDSDNMLAYLLRAQVEYNHGKRKVALLDISTIQSSIQADVFAPFVAAVLNRDFDCTDLFNSQKIAEVMQKYGSMKAADIAATLTALPTPTLAATPTPEATAAPAVVPMGQGEYMVLVAPFTPVRTDAYDAAGLIAQDLKQHFETEAPYSKLRVRQYPSVITSDDEARAAAESVGASVVIWGNYTADTVNANVQIGSLAAFKYNHFERAALEKTANVQAQMSDVTKQSLAPQVLSVMGVLYTADGDAYRRDGIWVVLNTLKSLTPATPVSQSVAVHTYGFYINYLENPDQSLEEMNQAINLDVSNALSYAFRIQAINRGAIVKAAGGASVWTNDQRARMAADAASAEQFAPAGWTLVGTLNPATENQADMARAIELRPDDWYYYYALSTGEVNSGNWEAAREDLDKSIALNPDIRLPQAIAVRVALHQGRIADAAALADEVRENIIADTFYVQSLQLSGFGPQASDPSLAYAPFSKLIVGQYQDTRDIVVQLATSGKTLDPILLGLALCGLGDTDNAMVAFKSINTSDYFVVNLLKAALYQKQGNEAAVLEQVGIAQRSNQAELLAPFAAAVLNGEFDCTDLFNSQKVAEVMQKYGTVTAPDIAATLTAVPTP